jgi:hypothetical protein
MTARTGNALGGLALVIEAALVVIVLWLGILAGKRAADLWLRESPPERVEAPAAPMWPQPSPSPTAPPSTADVMLVKVQACDTCAPHLAVSAAGDVLFVTPHHAPGQQYRKPRVMPSKSEDELLRRIERVEAGHMAVADVCVRWKELRGRGEKLNIDATLGAFCRHLAERAVLRARRGE